MNIAEEKCTVRCSSSSILILTPNSHLLGSLNYRCTNKRLSEQKSENFLVVNSVFVAAYHRYAVAKRLVMA